MPDVDVDQFKPHIESIASSVMAQSYLHDDDGMRACRADVMHALCRMCDLLGLPYSLPNAAASVGIMRTVPADVREKVARDAARRLRDVRTDEE